MRNSILSIFKLLNSCMHACMHFDMVWMFFWVAVTIYIAQLQIVDGIGNCPGVLVRNPTSGFCGMLATVATTENMPFIPIFRV